VVGGDYLILEKESAPGGLCRSFDLGGTTFDLGGHAFFTGHDDVRELVTELSAPGLFRQPRRAWVASHGTMVPYPFQGNLHGLPVDVVRECLVGLFDVVSKPPEQPTTNLREWLAASFGPGLNKHFLRPYNEKIWAFPLEDVAPDWALERVIRPDVDAIVAGALERKDFVDFPNVVVAYPATGGFWNMYAGFLRTVGDHVRTGDVERVSLRGRYVVTSQGERVEYDQMISTMPLTELVARAIDPPPGASEAAAKLKHNSLHLVNLVVGRGRVTEIQRLYCADPEVPFHKLVMNSNSSDDLRNRDVFGFQAEISFSEHKTIDKRGMEERVHQSLLDFHLIEPDDVIVASSTLDVEHAYPVYTAETRAAREFLLGALEEHGVLCAGRFGEWLYINSDDAVLRGKSRAQQLRGSSGHG
jgi:protoporphyrinogen oxidase